jgi:hypothetical protein
MQRIDYGANKGQFQANNYRGAGARDRPRGRCHRRSHRRRRQRAVRPEHDRLGSRSREPVRLRASVKAARARAETYAEAAGLKVARVLAIRDGGESGPMPYHVGDSSAAMVQTAAPPPPPVRGGMNTSQVQVRADFALSAN